MRNNRKGFTLIELIMVIVILGTLAAIAVPRFNDFRKAANQAACKGSGGALRAAISNYYASTAIHTNTAAWPSACTWAVISSEIQSWPKSPAGYGGTGSWSAAYNHTTGALSVETVCTW